MPTKHTTLLLIALISVLLIPLLGNCASAQTEPYYYVTVNPEILGNALQYTNVGRNATLSFTAQWGYNGSQIQNATTVIVVTDQNNKVVDMFLENTTSGVFSFNYSTTTPSILNFTPTKLTTADGKEWANNTLVPGENAYEFVSNFAQVYFDTFQVSAVNFDTNTIGKVAATVNVTYLMLPEDGLQISISHLSKIGQGLNISINGVVAQEIAPGIYTATSSTWFSTTYVNVQVSGNNWATTNTAFGVTQNANQPLWIYGVTFASIASIAALLIRFMASKRSNRQQMSRHPNFAFFGGVTLTATSVISLYWGAVGFEGTIHTFNWFGLAGFGIFAFLVGIIGCLSLTRRKYQPLSITTTIVPMIANVVLIKGSLDMYMLASPWILLVGAFVLSVLSGFFICNIDSVPQKLASDPQNLTL